MDPRLFSEWARVDDRLRRAIIVRDALGCGQQHEPRMTANHWWLRAYHGWSLGGGEHGGSCSSSLVRSGEPIYVGNCTRPNWARVALLIGSSRTRNLY